MWPYSIHGRPDASPTANAGDAGAGASASSAEGDTNGVSAPQPAAASSAALPSPELDHAMWIYELAGIVIHMGTAIGGHYYSYIRERSAGGALTGAWMEFNDNFVSPWDATDASLDSDCFGGVETFTTGGYSYFANVNGVSQRVTTQSYTTERVRSASAFILFYDRVPRERAVELLRPPATGRKLLAPSSALTPARRGAVVTRNTGASGAPPVAFEVVNGSAARAVFSEHVRVSHGGSSDHARLSVRGKLPPELASEIRQDNLEFWKQRTVCEDAYVTFVDKLVRAAAEDAKERSLSGQKQVQEQLAVASLTYPWGGIAGWDSAALQGGPAMPAFRLAIAFVLNTFAEKVCALLRPLNITRTACSRAPAAPGMCRERPQRRRCLRRLSLPSSSCVATLSLALGSSVL
jgi:hypothetical protein